MNGSPILREADGGIELRVRLKPNSRVDDLEGIDEERNALVIRVRGKPVDGVANRCLLEFIRKKFGVKGASIVRGSRSHMKTIRIPGDARIMNRIEEVIKEMK